MKLLIVQCYVSILQNNTNLLSAIESFLKMFVSVACSR
jgi:hypothetical protein